MSESFTILFKAEQWTQNRPGTLRAGNTDRRQVKLGLLTLTGQTLGVERRKIQMYFHCVLTGKTDSSKFLTWLENKNVENLHFKNENFLLKWSFLIKTYINYFKVNLEYSSFTSMR